MTTRELAEYLCYRGPHTQTSAQKWVKRKGLRRYWRGRAVLVKREDVDKALAGEPYRRERTSPPSPVSRRGAPGVS